MHIENILAWACLIAAMACDKPILMVASACYAIAANLAKKKQEDG